MTKCYFITGTDTEIGKTVISITLLQTIQKYGYVVAGYKPVASGSKVLSDGLLYNNDALLLQKNSNLPLSYRDINRYTFFEPTSPHIASVEEHKLIEFTALSAGLNNLKHKADYVLIEGAGGWFTPLSEQQTFADWVILEQLPVILVVGIKSGCINHAILTAQAIMLAKLHLIGWIANSIIPPNKWHNKYIITLKKMLSVPLLGEISWLGKNFDYSNIDNFFNSTALQQYILPAKLF